MRFALLAVTIGALGLLSAPRDAYGQTSPPDARKGFQIGLRTGVALPFGAARGPAQFASTGVGGVYGVSRLDMTEMTRWQIPLLVDVGAKVSPYVHLGGYLGASFGSGENCAPYPSCFTMNLRVGLAIHYFFRPTKRVDPWIGYGVGVESIALGHRDPSYCEWSRSLSGIEFGHLMAGFDVRMSRVFGIGPFVDASVGEYFRESKDLAGCAQGFLSTAFPSGNVESPDFHYWVTVGPRVVFFP